jgi:hypothetical protein
MFFEAFDGRENCADGGREWAFFLIYMWEPMSGWAEVAVISFRTLLRVVMMPSSMR